MKGLIKKDLAMIKKNNKLLIVSIGLYLLYTIQFDIDMSFFLPMMAVMACVSTMTYDDFNNWHFYSISLPTGKAGYVKSKYIVTLSITLLVSVLSYLLQVLICIFKHQPMENTFEFMVGISFAAILLISIIFPILIKYGSEKGRIWMMIIGFGSLGIGLVVPKFIHIEISSSFITFLDTYFPIVMVVTTVGLLVGSYLLSKKIYLNKEF